jgi:cell division protein FtsB
VANRRPTAPRSGAGRAAGAGGASGGPGAAAGGPSRGHGHRRATAAPSGTRAAGRATGRGSAPAASRRPAAAARPRTAPAQPLSAPRGLSRRAAFLAALLLIVGIAIAPFLRDAVNQQARLASLEREVSDRQQRVDDLQQQLDRWNDPAFVKAQARQRLKFVMPGEVGYIVLDEAVDEQAEQSPSRAAVQEVAGSNRPWFGSLWESVREADQPDQPPPASLQPDVDTSGGTKPAPAP